MLSEVDVQAFVDGSLAPERAAQVRLYLSARPDEARRVAFYGQLNRRMRASFEDGASPGPSMLTAHAAFAQRALRAAAVLGWLRAHVRAIIALVLLLATIAGAALWALRVPAPVLDAAALMVLEHTMSSDASAANAAGLSRAAPNLSDLGWQPVARTSAPVGPWTRATGFVYRNRAGDRAVLLTVRDWTAASQPQWQARRVGGMRLLGWTTTHTRYLLAGRAQMAGLMRAADEMAPH